MSGPLPGTPPRPRVLLADDHQIVAEGIARLLSEDYDLLAILSAGAYGMTMSSNYNTRPRAAEVLVDGSEVHVIRERETLEHLLKGERPLP